MKRNYLISALVFSSVLLFQLGCQEQAKLPEKPATAPETRVVGSLEKAEASLASLDKAAPKITFENVVHDFGQIGTGANKRVAEFKFTNTGDALLEIMGIGSVEATKFILDPRVDMEKLNNNLKGSVNVSLTHPEEKEAEILFDVIPKYAISPPLIITFNAEPQNPIVRKVTVLNKYGGDFEIESVSSKNNTVTVLSREKIRDGYQFNVEIMPPLAEGKTQFVDAFVVKIKGGNELGVVCRGFYKRK